jgi:hypothetical protein
MLEGFEPKLEIDRKDVNGNYEPGNCRWITHAEQAGNKRTTTNLTYQGKTQNIRRWAAELGVTERMIRNRINVMGWDAEKALSTPPMSKSDTTALARKAHWG